MSKRIILSLIFAVGVLINLYNFTDVFGDTAIPKVRLFGTSTTLTDSTNYINFNKGINIPDDSLKVGKYLFVGTKGGGIYLDTNRKGEIIYSGVSLQFFNNKENGSMDFWIGEKSSEFYWYKSEGGAGTLLMTLDTVSGLALTNLNISTSGTGQVKLPSDTATDYDGNNSVTVNRQSGFVTTKSLTTAAGTAYDLTLANSLITATSKIHAMVIYGGGTCTNLAMVIHVASIGTGSCLISVYNPSTVSALNGTVRLQFWVWN